MQRNYSLKPLLSSNQFYLDLIFNTILYSIVRFGYYYFFDAENSFDWELFSLANLIVFFVSGLYRIIKDYVLFSQKYKYMRIQILGETASGKTKGPVTWLLKKLSQKGLFGIIVQFNGENLDQFVNATVFNIKTVADFLEEKEFITSLRKLPAGSFVYFSTGAISNNYKIIFEVFGRTDINIIVESQIEEIGLEHFNTILSNGVRPNVLPAGQFKDLATNEIYSFDDSGNSIENKIEQLYY